MVVREEHPEHPVDRPELRTFGGALQRSELLPEGEVFKEQFMMSAARQGERSDEKENHLQHATDPVMLRDENQRGISRIEFWRPTVRAASRESGFSTAAGRSTTV